MVYCSHKGTKLSEANLGFPCVSIHKKFTTVATIFPATPDICHMSALSQVTGSINTRDMFVK